MVFGGYLMYIYSHHAIENTANQYAQKPMYVYILLDGLAYNTHGYFASCVVFFRAPQGRGKMQAMSKMSASIKC